MPKISVLVPREELKAKTEEIAKRISKDYEGKDLLLVGVLKGGFMFLSDLCRAISIDVNIDFISVSSYGNSTVSSGVVRILKDIDYDITGKHILLVEDLIDSGLTLWRPWRTPRTDCPRCIFSQARYPPSSPPLRTLSPPPRPGYRPP